MLSKEYLRGDKPAAKLYVHDESFYDSNAGDKKAEMSVPMNVPTSEYESLPYPSFVAEAAKVPN